MGHSFAGQEMTRFAELNPARCAGLIYIDAAYDRTAIPAILQATPPPPPPAMRAPASASVDALRGYIARVAGVAVPKSEILATSRFDASGRLLGSITPDSLEGRLWEASRTPRYCALSSRALEGQRISERARGERIPIEARIVGMVDSFEALTHERPFRPAWTLQKTLAFIGDESGGLFDPQVVTAFLRLRRAGVDLLSSE